MDALANRPAPLSGAWRGLVWLGGAAVTLVTGALAAVLAVAFTAALAMLAVIGMGLVGFTAAALRKRRPAGGPEVIEARHMGGQSWVAYGWDRDSGRA